MQYNFTIRVKFAKIDFKFHYLTIKKRLPPGRVSYFLINPFGDTYEYRYSLPGEHLLTIIIGQKQRPRLLTKQAIRVKTAILLELSYGEIDILAKLIIDGQRLAVLAFIIQGI